jgi:hypothetical protein
MTLIPDELMLRQGAIFRMIHEFSDEGEKYRFFIVLNYNPQSDILVILTSTTTQLAKLERRYRNEALSPLIYIHPNECAAFTELCAVDCKALITKEKSALLSTMKAKRHEFVDTLPDSKLHEIHAYISQAPDIPYSLKSLIVED